MGDLSLEIGWQVDDGNGIERAFLRADTTTNAKTFRNEGDLGVGRNLDAELARANYGTRPD